MVLESESTAENFGHLLVNLLQDDARREAMARAASKLQPRDADCRVADIIEREARA
jgi:UDP-N-acetylglucosamine:LPS N-acetylglucosamine transferase